MRDRASTIAYLVVSSLFALGVLAQVFLVGLSLLGGRPSWAQHIGLGHSLSLPLLLMLVLAYLGRMPRPVKPLTWAAFGVYATLADIVIFMRDSAPFVAALHPVLAIVLFALAANLAGRAWGLARRQAGRIEAAATGEEMVVRAPSERAA